MWRLRLLGTFELTDGRQRHHKLATRAAMALLARLCMRPDSAHPREELVDLLWPEAPADAGRQRLRQTLSTLKQVLEPPGLGTGQVLDADRIAIRLVGGSLHCDALEFAAAFKRGAHDQAHALYAGEFMPGFFEEWIGDERLRLEGLYDRLQLPAHAAGPAAVATRSAPGGPVTVRAPAMKSAPALPTPRHALPGYLTRLIGADSQTLLLRRRVVEHRLVTLLGPGGAGKTRLSVEVARSLVAVPAPAPQASARAPPATEPGKAGEDFDTVAFVPLATCRTRQQLLDQVLLSLHLTVGSAGALESLVQALDGRAALLVLDNFEQLVDEGAELVAELASRLPLLHLLVTSRRALALNGEHEVWAATLSLPSADDDLATAGANPAVALFVERARAARAEFHLHEGNRAAIIGLVQGLEGMPLAIELAAARVRSMAPAEMAATLARARQGPSPGLWPGEGAAGSARQAAPASALDLLARTPAPGRQDTRHHSMVQTIDWSWQLLGPELRTLLARLTVFQGGFTAEAAHTLQSLIAPDTTAGNQAGAVLWQLDDLLSHSLLRASPTTQGAEQTRFSLYEPIREFAARTLAPTDAAHLRSSHRDWALSWARTMPPTPPLAALRTEWRNLTAAMVGAVDDGQPLAALDIALALRPALDFVGLPSAGQAALQAALAACGDAPQRSAGLAVLAIDMLRSGQGGEGLRLAEQAVAQAPADAPELRARALVTAVVVAFNVGERCAALLQRLEEALALARRTGHEALQARVLGVLADVKGLSQGDVDGADALHQQALQVWTAQGNQLAALRSRYALAQMADAHGRHEAVLAQIGPVIETARELQALTVLAPSLNLQSETLATVRRWPEALAAGCNAMQTAWQALDTWNTLLSMHNLHVVLAHSGQPLLAQQVAGFISHSWEQRFGPLTQRSRFAQRRTRRLACVQSSAAASAAAFAQGQALSLAEVVAKVLHATAR